MYYRVPAIALIMILMIAAPGAATTVEVETADGAMTLVASDILVLGNGFVATGSARIKWVDPVRKAILNAEAKKITVTIANEQPPAATASAKGAKTARPRTVIKSAVLAGPVKMTYVTTGPNGKSTITANANNADFDGRTNLARLTGNVKIVNDDPALFSVPATMTGDKATVNLKPVGPEDFRFRVETAEPGTSTITATPRARKAE